MDVGAWFAGPNSHRDPIADCGEVCPADSGMKKLSGAGGTQFAVW
jgi:hypothetical protein